MLAPRHGGEAERGRRRRRRGSTHSLTHGPTVTSRLPSLPCMHAADNNPKTEAPEAGVSKEGRAGILAGIQQPPLQTIGEERSRRRLCPEGGGDRPYQVAPYSSEHRMISLFANLAPSRLIAQRGASVEPPPADLRLQPPHMGQSRLADRRREEVRGAGREGCSTSAAEASSAALRFLSPFQAA